MNKKQLASFQELLEGRREEILGTARKSREGGLGLDVDDLPDEMDLASSEQNKAVEFRIRGREKLLLAKVEAALLRIEDGNFGLCEDCGEEIGPQRLKARPVTTLCIDCKEAQEKSEKAFG